jgi:ATP-dependent Clp protease adapter protein ClpS
VYLMRDVPAEARSVQIFLYDDNDTPWAFVIELLRSVFSMSEVKAKSLAARVEKQGRATCGAYPPAVAEALLKAAEEAIQAAGYCLPIAGEPMGGRSREDEAAWSFCGKSVGPTEACFQSATARRQ